MKLSTIASPTATQERVLTALYDGGDLWHIDMRATKASVTVMHVTPPRQFEIRMSTVRALEERGWIEEIKDWSRDVHYRITKAGEKALT